MKTLQGTITVLKDKEGNIKIPRTTANAVQLVSGNSVQTAIENIYTKSEIDVKFANLTLNGEITLDTYATVEDINEAINNHTHSYNDLTDTPEILSIEEAVSKEFLQNELAKLPIVDTVEILEQLNMKVDIVEGKDLSSNDFDDYYKGLLDTYHEELKNVAFTGSYNDLKDTPLVDVTKSYVDALVSMRSPIGHTHSQYLTYLPDHNHDEFYYTKNEIDNKLDFISFKANEDAYDELKTENKTIIGAINELYDGRITSTSVEDVELSNLSTEEISSPVLSGINDNFDYMQQKIDALEARIRELEALLK